MSSSLQYTPVDQVPKIIQELRQSSDGKIAHPIEFRRNQLLQLIRLLEVEEQRLVEAVKKDLHKPYFEAVIMEVAISRNEAIQAVDHLQEWTTPERPSVSSLLNKLDDVHIRRDPLGLVLIIGAWNYPIQLVLLPLVGAIAAGNVTVLKPSELAPHTAQVLAELLPKYLDQRVVRVINGAVQETSALLEQRFDHIFYTGSGNVGKIVMAAAAKNLASVTLELGGKSPVIVDETANIKNTANRIASGKTYNSGQTCLAPDFVLVHESKETELIAAFREAFKTFYPTSARSSEYYGRIVNRNHFNRLKKILDASKGKVVIGGETDEDQLFIAPTIVTGVSPEDSLMRDEIFGPILPILTFKNLSEAIAFVNSRDKPLGLYAFSTSKKNIERILTETTSGGVTINDVIFHASVPELPFGGVGPSGTGSYHGRATFEVFSHKKSILVKSSGLEFLNEPRYPPYEEAKTKRVISLTRKKLASKFLPSSSTFRFLVGFVFVFIFRERIIRSVAAFFE